MEKTKELLKALVMVITDKENKDDIQILEKVEEEKIELLVILKPEDMPKVIGKDGRIAKSIRSLVRNLTDTDKNIYIRFDTEESDFQKYVKVYGSIFKKRFRRIKTKRR